MKQSHDFNIAESKDDFLGWEILAIEDYKLDVKRVYMRAINPNGSGVFMIVYSDTEYTEGLSVNAYPLR
jgi:hypothetical protein